jgi:ketosteroid isomerase-like protein
MAALAAAGLTPQAGSGAAHMANAAQDVRAVLEAFREAVIAKDKNALLELFFPGGVSWVGAYGDASVDRGVREHPERAKAFADSPAAFIDALKRSDRPFEETFSNVSISADADVAAVTFDYVFLQAGSALNHGKECWHLVRTTHGWKITSVIFSVNF